METKKTRDAIFGNYIKTRDNAPVKSDHYIPHARNLEGFEDMFLKFMPSEKDARILDIGCGCGQLLYMLREKDYKNIRGVEIGRTQAEITRRLGIAADHTDDLVEYLKKNSGWDVVIMSQVIEHFPKEDVYLYLEAVKESMNKGGDLIIATPNVTLLSGTFQRYIDFTHETAFTERSLGEVLRVCGFGDIEIYPDTPSFRWRPKFLIWLLLRNIWFGILTFIYLLERGAERPRIISRHLIAVAKKI
jgi:SAM-dependent methyltransferase